MHTYRILFASIIASAAALPYSPGSYLELGADCTPGSTPCANGAICYAVTALQQTQCGNFQATCQTNDQCAYNTCENGFCSGFKAATTSTTSSAPTATPVMAYLPIGAACNPNSTPCANGASCYASNASLQPVCGNFQALCISSDQCAYNICVEGFCSGFKATTTPAAPTYMPTPTPTPTPAGY
ncbi:hypothetical protein PZA11_001480 [Diplocarpon coronariae]